VRIGWIRYQLYCGTRPKLANPPCQYDLRHLPLRDQ
jgi:hypothetical protein